MFGRNSFQFILLSCLNLTLLLSPLTLVSSSGWWSVSCWNSICCLNSGHLFVNWLLNRIWAKNTESAFFIIRICKNFVEGYTFLSANICNRGYGKVDDAYAHTNNSRLYRHRESETMNPEIYSVKKKNIIPFNLYMYTHGCMYMWLVLGSHSPIRLACIGWMRVSVC